MTQAVTEIVFIPLVPDESKRPVNATDFRKLLWMLGGDTQLPKFIWNYDEEGNGRHEMAEIRFVNRGKGRVGMIALSDRARDELQVHLRTLHRLSIAIFKSPLVQLQTNEYEIGADIEEKENGAFRVRFYDVSSMILGTHKKHRKIAYGDDVEAKKALVEQVIRVTLDNQAQVFGKTLPPYFIKLEKDWVPKFVPVSAARKDTLSLPRCTNFTFTSNLLLKGPWAVGSLTSKGYGNIRQSPWGIAAPVTPEALEEVMA